MGDNHAIVYTLVITILSIIILIFVYQIVLDYLKPFSGLLKDEKIKRLKMEQKQAKIDRILIILMFIPLYFIEFNILLFVLTTFLIFANIYSSNEVLNKSKELMKTIEES